MGEKTEWLEIASEVELVAGLMQTEKRDMPRKIRELIADLEAAGFENRGGKGSHRNFKHPPSAKTVTISGKLGADAKPYQEQLVKNAIRESRK